MGPIWAINVQVEGIASAKAMRGVKAQSRGQQEACG